MHDDAGHMPLLDAGQQLPWHSDVAHGAHVPTCPPLPLVHTGMHCELIVEEYAVLALVLVVTTALTLSDVDTAEVNASSVVSAHTQAASAVSSKSICAYARAGGYLLVLRLLTGKCARSTGGR